MPGGLMFVAGMARSGTSALADVMSAHPRVVLGVERYKRLYGRNGQAVSAGHFDKAQFFDFRDGLTNLTPDTSPKFSGHYEAMRAKWDAASYVGDKLVAVHLQHVWQTLPDARFVCIVRDLEAVAASWDARARDPADVGWPSRDDAMRAVKVWNRSLRRIRRAVRQRPQHAVVVEHGRFFGDASGSAYHAVLDWLGLDRGPEVDAAFQRAHRIYLDKVAGRPSVLPPDVAAYLDLHAERQTWRQVAGRLAL